MCACALVYNEAQMLTKAITQNGLTFPQSLKHILSLGWMWKSEVNTRGYVQSVGTRVAGMHTQLEEEEAQEHTTQSSITQCVRTKIR